MTPPKYLAYRLIASLVSLVIVAPFTTSSLTAQGVPPLTKALTGPVKLTPPQQLIWKNMVSGLTTHQPASALFVLDTGFKRAPTDFPDGAGVNRIYGKPGKPAKMLLRIDGPASSGSFFILQFASSPNTQNLVAPYAGWKAPNGLVDTIEYKLLVRSQPLAPADALHAEAPLVAGTPGLGSVKVTAGAKYVYFEQVLPVLAVSKTGTSFYLRVVAISTATGKQVAQAPPSNWIHFIVTMSEAEQAKVASDAAAAKVKAAADAAVAQAKIEAAKQQQAIVAAVGTAQKALWAAYEIRLLSYAPPKFYDDADALLYFRASSSASPPNASIIKPGDDYNLTTVKNIINSQKTWHQELWDLATAELNLASTAYAKAKSDVVDVVASGIGTIGINCQSDCKAGIMAGLNLALAACGIPPAVPNIEALYGGGLDYLALTIADAAIEEITGVAIDDLGANVQATTAAAAKLRGPAKDGMKSMLDKLIRPAPFQADVPETWGRPSPFFRHRPAMLYLEIRRKPGTALPVGQTWQGLSLSFNGEFETIDLVRLPRKIGETLRIPIVMVPTQGPEGWTVDGWMPDAHKTPGLEAGQPYYKERGSLAISITSINRLDKSGTTFKAGWPAIGINPARVNGIDTTITGFFTTAKLEAALNGPVMLAPADYFGKVRYNPWTP